MSAYAELEIGLHRRDLGVYNVDFRYNQSDSDADIRLSLDEDTKLSLDLEALSQLTSNNDAYSQKLSQDFFANPNIQSVFSKARTSAASQNLDLRIRLLVGQSAPELNKLRWETLRDPEDGAALFFRENLLFSRYLSSLDWRPVRLRPQADLSALVVVANPSNLHEYNLAPLDVAAEQSRARQNLGQIQVTELPEPDGDQHATQAALFTSLRAQTCDILYIVCHGALINDEPWLWLEDEDGYVQRVCGTDLVARLRELNKRPRLVVLASCESAGDKTGDALSALGPRLTEAGIPAVIAMQGKISLETLSQFMPVFFSELVQDGQIDRAMAVARGVVRGRSDYWMPALYMRLKSGRIWYVPGFGDERKGFEKWPALVRSIRRGQCTPILGPGLYEPMLGAPREIAQRWSEAYHYPMATHERESLPQVAQYLTINQYRQAPYDELIEYLESYIQERYQAELPPELSKQRARLDELVSAVGQQRRATLPAEPYKVLAQLPLPIYISTNPDNLLRDALLEAGRDPQVVLCPWNEYIEQVETVYDREPDYFPTPERPLVYHLFGELDNPNSVVLTEDDYFDFLIGVTSNKDLIPTAVRRALADTALLFLGFQMDDWNFRVLFRSILSQQGGGRRDRYAHIAAQIEPDEGRILEPGRARRYLENYFAKGADISLYWGSAEDFISELNQHWDSEKR